MHAQITSVFNGKTYGTRNGKFSAHLKQNGYSYQQYYEQFISKQPAPSCPYCEANRKFAQDDDSYKTTCGAKLCANKAVRDAHLSRSKEDVAESTKARKATTKALYGVENVSKLESVQNKLRESEQKIQESGLTAKQEQQQAARATKKHKYGDEFYNNATAISDSKARHTVAKKNEIHVKRTKTNLNRYGVENILTLPEVREKAQPSNAKLKLFNLPSGRRIKVQGNEPYAIRKLLETFTENDLVISDAGHLTTCGAPVIVYINKNRSHGKYYPDIFIPSENRIIEVKSQWWYDGNGAEKYKGRLENNLRKKDAAIKAGYKFEFWVFDSKGNYEVK